MKSIMIHHHLGLGDHIICNGLVRELLEKENANFAYLPVKKQYYKTVSQMYSDDFRIVCIPVISESAGSRIPYLPQMESCEKIYRVGFEKVRGDWDVSFYDSVGIPFEKRWTSFKMKRNLQQEVDFEKEVNPSGDPFVLVHQNNSGWICKINLKTNLRVISIDDYSTDSLLNWCGMIEKAKEIHCVDSCFIHLCSSMDVRGVFHDFGINKNLGYKFVLHPSWEKIEIDEGTKNCIKRQGAPFAIGL